MDYDQAEKLITIVGQLVHQLTDLADEIGQMFSTGDDQSSEVNIVEAISRLAAAVEKSNEIRQHRETSQDRSQRDGTPEGERSSVVSTRNATTCPKTTS